MEPADSRFKTIVLNIEGEGPSSGAELLDRKLRSLAGVEGYERSSESDAIQILYDPSRISPQDIVRSVSETGMTCSLVRDRERRSIWWRDRQQLALYSSGMITLTSFILMFLGVQDIITNALFGVAVLVGVFYPARKAIIALLNLVFTIHLLMLIGATGAVLLGMWYEAAILIFVYSLGDVLESYAVDKARGAIRSLVELIPKRALVRKDGNDEMMSTEDIVVGDIVIVRPGERIPVDGTVCHGTSYVDQAAVTGEPVPVGRTVGDEVFAGTINQNGSLEVRVDKPASETMLSKIICSVEEAQAERTSYQRFSDSFAQYYTPAMFVLGVIIATVPPLFFGAEWHTFILRGLVVFVVSCSCGLALSVPTAVVAAMANAARNGTVYKGGTYLEAVSKVRIMAFDKTGTLTIGRPQVTEVIPYDRLSERDVLEIASSIELRSGHPLADAIVRKAKESDAFSGLPAEDFQEIAGLGVTARVSGKEYLIGNQRLLSDNGASLANHPDAIEELESSGKTVVSVSSEGKLIGLIAIADGVRPGAREALQRLKQAGIRTVMLTGDNERSARAIALQVGVDEYHSQLLPVDKVEIVKRLKESHGVVAMVGDGINDAPAMAASDVGIAMGAAGTDIAIEAGDVVLMSDDLSKLWYLRELSDKAVAIIKQNIWFSLINITFMVGAALLGYLGLVSGLLLNEASAVLVILNAIRLLKWKSKAEGGAAMDGAMGIPPGQPAGRSDPR